MYEVITSAGGVVEVDSTGYATREAAEARAEVLRRAGCYAAVRPAEARPEVLSA